jgi:hypothetical protein
MDKSNAKTAISRMGQVGSALLLGAVIGFSTQSLAQQQPNMQAALDSLRQARNQLLQATNDKGGYRVKALTDVNNAIINVEKGIRFDYLTPNGNSTIQSSICDLSQRGRRLFNGNCDLRRRITSNGTAYSVELQDGRRFAFYNRQGELVLRDGTGIWLARYARSGSGVLFTWSDLRLETRRDVPQGYPHHYPQSYPPIQNPTGQFFQDLFNNLFR